MSNEKRVLFYDLETTPLKAYIWQLGQQFVRHGQLVDGFAQTKIICMAWCWNDGKPAKVVDWGVDQDDTGIVKKFDELVSEADIVIGKNSDRFDNKVMNTRRLFLGLPCLPDWVKYTDDLEKQIRKHFRLASNSLDYLSKELGFGGKDKMQFSDWIDIVEKQCSKALNKMKKYNRKDTEDLRDIWNYCEKFITPKFQYRKKGEVVCKNCNSNHLIKFGVAQQGITRYQQYWCKACDSYAGRKAVKD
jgi:hypothetical protein